MIYVVEMISYGDREKHSYVKGVTNYQKRVTHKY